MTEMEIIAHRGASYDAPENTEAAIRLAWIQQADAVEIDIQLARDGAIVVMHDGDTRRTTGVEGKIAELTLEQLRRLDAGSWKDAAFSGQRVPTLDEVLTLVPPGKRIFIELKGQTEAIIAPLRACLERSALLPEQIFLVGFDYNLMKQVRATLTHWRVLWIQGWTAPTNNAPDMSLDKLIALSQDADFAGVSLSFRWPIDKDFVRRVDDAGLKFSVWTVDDGEIAQRLADAGVESITSNRPAWLRQQLQANNIEPVCNYFTPAVVR